MKEISPDQLDPRLQKHLAQAVAAIDQGRPDYAATVATQLVKRHPECAEARRVLRRAQLAASSPRGYGGAFFSLLGGAALKWSGRKDPLQCLEQAEFALAKDPRNRAALELLTEAAERQDWWETARGGYETLHELFPDDLLVLQRLGRALVKLGQLEVAVSVGERILQLKPGDAEGQRLVKQASVEHSLRSGRWEEDGNFRDKLRDDERARQLEQASRIAGDGGGMESRRQELEKSIQERPEDVRLYRQLAEILRREGDWSGAATWIAAARQTPTGRVDSTLEHLENDYRTGELEAELAEAEQSGDNSNIDSARQALGQYRMDRAREQAERYPNDARVRFEFGELLLGTRNFDGAVKELQQARRDPNLRIRALLQLGRAYRGLGFQDLALNEFNAALEGLPESDPLRMDLLYESACSQEDAGNRDEAFALYKEIYSRDVNFRDVAVKVKAYYA